MTHRSPLSRGATLALALSLVPGLANSGLTDPTRPLAGAAAPEPVASGGTRTALPAAAPAAAPAEPQLQSLQLPRDGVASALVDGQLLRAGQRWNAFEIIAIDAQGVLAKGPGGPQRWTLVGVHYLDPKARARLAPAAPAQPALAASSGAASAMPAAASVGELRTAQWQFTPQAARPAAPALPPTTRLSWADLVAPASRPLPAAVAPTPTPTPRTSAGPAAAQTLRLPTAQARQMPAAAGPAALAQAPALALARTRAVPEWRGLHFEWPVAAQAAARQPQARTRGPLRGPVPPSVVLARPTGRQSVGLRWTASLPSAEPLREWWTPPPPRSAARPGPAVALSVARARLPQPAPRKLARVAVRHARVVAVHSPLPSVLPRTPGPRLIGVVALNKETP